MNLRRVAGRRFISCHLADGQTSCSVEFLTTTYEKIYFVLNHYACGDCVCRLLRGKDTGASDSASNHQGDTTAVTNSKEEKNDGH
jgi:hypothetical protein